MPIQEYDAVPSTWRRPTMPYVHKFAMANCIAGLAFMTTFLLCPDTLLGQTSDAATKTTFKVEVISNLIIMPGYVNDSPKLDVALDTGASVNVLTPERAAELKVKVDRQFHSTRHRQR